MDRLPRIEVRPPIWYILVQFWMFKGGDYHQGSKGDLVWWFITFSVHQSGHSSSRHFNPFWHMKSRILITDRFITDTYSLPNKATPGYLRPQRIRSFNLYTDNSLFSDLIYPYLCAWPTLSLFVDTSSNLTKPSCLLTYLSKVTVHLRPSARFIRLQKCSRLEYCQNGIEKGSVCRIPSSWFDGKRGR